MFALSVLAIQATLAASAAALCVQPSVTPEDFAQQRFDYVVVGSGPGGLPVAVRLSENPNVRVAVIEAGQLLLNNSLIDVPGYSGRNIGNATYDWNFNSVPQPYAMNRQISQPRGKMVGGSTGLNLMAWDRASKNEYDAWALLSGDAGWSFDRLLPYLKKVENLSNVGNNYPGISAAEQVAATKAFPYLDSFTGPVNISLNTVYSDVVRPLVQAYNVLGVKTNANPYGGKTTGVRNERINFDVKRGTRSYAATAYYCPASTRKNLVMLTGAMAKKIVFSNTADRGLKRATSVVFSSGGRDFTVQASREVIVAAGTFQTPQLLELSGIGNSSLLSSLGIRPVVDLPGVGENLQDQLYVPNQYRVTNTTLTLDRFNNPAFSQGQEDQYARNRTGFLAATDNTLAFIPVQNFASSSIIQDLMRNLTTSLQKMTLTPLQAATYAIQKAWLLDESVPQSEIILLSKGLIAPVQGEAYFSTLSGCQHPFSRGSVHIGSSKVEDAPIISPNYLSHEIDVALLQMSSEFVNRLTEQAPMSKIVVERQFPVAHDAQDLEDWVRSTAASGSHPAGTAAMVPRSMGGVVDSSLKVYGTSNVRVVDASIFPIHIAAHTQATIYAISEKAADIIKSSQYNGY